MVMASFPVSFAYGTVITQHVGFWFLFARPSDPRGTMFRDDPVASNMPWIAEFSMLFAFQSSVFRDLAIGWEDGEGGRERWDAINSPAS
jgi:hypothetical protein